MQTILVATDYSPSAKNAVNYAAALAARTGARLHLLHAFQLSAHAANGLITAEGMHNLFDKYQSRLHMLSLKLQLEYGICTETHCINEPLETALHQLVQQKQADLVILGMHSSEWSDRLFGNTILRLIKAADYPLLVIPERAVYKGIKKILFAFDSRCLSSRNKLSMLRDIAYNYDAEVRLFHVDSSPKKVAAIEKDPIINLKMEAALSKIEHSYKNVVSSNVAEGIVKELAVYNADLLTVVPRKASFWYRLVNKSTTRKLAITTPVPILVLPNTSIK